MNKIPTDLEILGLIYSHYYSDFQVYSRENKTRSSKIYVPIDIAKIASKLNTDNDIVFGRLYYHLNKKYSYKNDNGSLVEFFTLSAGSDRHCVNFPYLASVFADLKDQNKKYLTATMIAVLSLIIAITSIIISIFYK